MLRIKYGWNLWVESTDLKAKVSSDSAVPNSNPELAASVPSCATYTKTSLTRWV